MLTGTSDHLEDVIFAVDIWLDATGAKVVQGHLKTCFSDLYGLYFGEAVKVNHPSD